MPPPSSTRSPGWWRSARPLRATCSRGCGATRSTCGESRTALDAWLREHDLRDAVELIGAKPLLLIHAEGDEQIPHQWSMEVYERAAEPRKLILLPGGHHRSAQHDAEVHGIALRWMERALAGRQSSP